MEHRKKKFQIGNLCRCCKLKCGRYDAGCYVVRSGWALLSALSGIQLGVLLRWGRPGWVGFGRARNLMSDSGLLFLGQVKEGKGERGLGFGSGGNKDTVELWTNDLIG